MPGYISDNERASLYQHASLFVLPSIYEGFGMPLLEAMHYSVPVIASDIPVFHEVAGDAAVYVDQNSPAAISKAIEQVITDKPLQMKLKKSGHKQLEGYSWDTAADLVFAQMRDYLTKR